MDSRNDPQAMRMALRAYITTPTWADSCRVLQQHPELPSDAADTLPVGSVPVCEAGQAPYARVGTVSLPGP